MSPRKSPSQIFKEARIQAGLTQQELGKKAGVHWNTIAKIERDEQEPSFETIKKLAKALNVKSSDLFPF
jgi:DNA-binding XRE family transcriptional regulator